MSYKDSSLSAEQRAEDLLSLMTVEEKIGQLIQPFGWKCYHKQNGAILLDESFTIAVNNGGVGSLYGVLRADPWTEVTLENGLSPEEGAQAINEIQRYAMEHSRLGIPILFGEECSHGHMAIGATVYPVPILLGSMWNVQLYRRMCKAIAAETRTQGGAATYSPVLDVVRDPRWGRTEECFGEDPFMIGEMAIAAVQGLQGERLDCDTSVIATLKHFAAYGSSEGGRNAGPAHIGLRELHENDLLPFRKAVQAGALSVMTAYNEIDGIPCTSNSYLLQQLLREEWGFDGFVITDCGAINMLAYGHDVAKDGEDAAAMALKAGVDMEMSGEMFGKHLLSALQNQTVTNTVLNDAVQRVLKIKFMLGLFERPYVDPQQAATIIGCQEHIELAREVAREGIILLKNDNSTLPLNKETGTIAVIGPNANDIYNQLGDYTSPQPRHQVVTLLDGIRNALGEQGRDRVLYAPGCRIKEDSREGFERALTIAAQADVIILALGGSSARDFGEGTIDLRTGASLVSGHSWSDMECGEGIDRTDLHLLGVQLELAQQIHKLGKPIIVVYMNGRPIVEPWIDENAHAIVEAWYPGQEGGNALAELLFGDANPSGRLTVSVPKHVGQLPVYYNGKRSRGKRYLEMDVKPRYPFGFGLSYTSFHYDNLMVTPERISPDDEAIVTVDITNTGAVAGAETVQLYITDVVSSITRPGKELKGFCKVMLQPGETRTVSFTVTREHLQLINERFESVVEEGEFKILVGRNAEDFLSTTLNVQKGE
ncbi:beta-glucosidase [Paenibacillus baekrokdamisoli]|uniref:Beta-glucosidase n=1 Tax=Paenibacillus baekrokdamisoli TaxID=1712516 RepID=A0A3G9J2G7_9BACL|nr:glycoside hydrolase family 3 N-terminal domain-containing protein [Paenibacillus baekrokdamisoli]MBB3069141.1 beta-glucosidase [Paenibacillus baekrokdamisoli]BBH18883.1 beta-glucosidase [Paenibacillus baekrokdamisoli]